MNPEAFTKLITRAFAVQQIPTDNALWLGVHCVVFIMHTRHMQVQCHAYCAGGQGGKLQFQHRTAQRPTPTLNPYRLLSIMSQLMIVFCVVALVAIAVGQPLAHARTYSIATGRGSIIRPGFENASGNIFFTKRSDDTSLNDENILEKRSAALGRAFFRPGRSMAIGRAGFRPGKRSIATGRAGFRPGKRGANDGPIVDENKLALLERILAESAAEQEVFMNQNPSFFNLN
uniref:FMRFamide-related neuropeptide n=1 Tax=Panagrellus redivivus TaxID=6233 RepID=A0A7E4VJL9_PANRE